MELDIKGILRILRKRVWIALLLAAVAGTGVGYYSYNYIEPVYEASTKVMVNKIRVEEGQQVLSPNELNAQIQLIATYKEVIKTPWVMEEVARANPWFDMSASELSSRVQVSSTNGTQVMTFSMSDTDYAKAAAVVNAVTDVFVAKIPGLMIDNLTVLNRANPAALPNPTNMDPQLNITIAALLAFIAGVALIMLIEYFDDSFKTEEVVRGYLDLPTLAVITRIRASDLRAHKAHPSGKSEKTGDTKYAAANQ